MKLLRTFWSRLNAPLIKEWQDRDVRDSGPSPNVAGINETMARTYFPGVSPIGRTFGLRGEVAHDPEWQNIEVVGLVRDGKYMRLQEKPMPAAFYLHAQHTGRYLGGFVVRYSGSAAAAVSAIRGVVREVDPILPLSDVTTLAHAVDDSVLNKRVAAQLATFSGVLAAFLVCIGIYGVMSWGIALRTGEFGVRVALGAALLAGYLPARRATRIDPMEALR